MGTAGVRAMDTRLEHAVMATVILITIAIVLLLVLVGCQVPLRP
jgi:hypothetical protein